MDDLKKIVVFGANGLVGSTFISDHSQDFNFLTPDISDLDILNTENLKKYFEENAPEYVINFAAFTNVETAEDQQDDKEGLCYQINVVGPKNLALECKERGIPLLHISTEYIFDGTKSGAPYTEEDKPNPINWYGMTKRWGDEEVQESGCEYLIVRISMPYAPFYELKSDIGRTFLRLLKEKQSIKALTDVRITPTYVSDISSAMRVLIDSDSRGVYHIATPTPVSTFAFVTEIAKQFGLDTSLISETVIKEYNNNKKAAMLQYSWLSPQKFINEFSEGILHSVPEGVALFKKAIDEKDQSGVS